MGKKSEVKKPEGKKPGLPSKTMAPSLRAQAEAELVRAPSTQATARSAEELLHELRVHQIELEMQNETLREYQLALEISRDRYADLYEFAPVGYITLTRSALISAINLTGAALLGVERNKLVKRHFATLVSSADRDKWHQIFMRALQQGEQQSCELVLQRDDGSCFHAHLNGLHRLEEGNVTIMRLTFSDISKFKEAEQLYSNVFEQASDGIVIIDTETGEIVEVNQALADMLVRDKHELIGKPQHILFPHKVVDPLCNTIWGHRSDKHAAKIETQLLTKNGQIHEVEITISVMNLHGRKVTFGIIRDVTERHHAQSREHRMRHILDNTLDMIFIFSPDTLKFVYINIGASKSIGYSREEMLHMSPMNVMSISEVECRAFIAPLASGRKERRRFEAMLKRSDGKNIPVEVQLQLVREDGDNGLFVAIVRDITRRKLAENELRRQKNLLWQVIDLDPSMIFVEDEAGRLMLANRAIADFYGVTIQDMIGRTSSELKLKLHQVSGFLVTDREAIKSGCDVTSTESILSTAGKQHWYLTNKRLMHQADGSINILGIAVDISELKTSGIKLDESYRELQRLALHLENVRAEERSQIARNLHDEMGATMAALKMRIAWLASKLPEGIPHLSDEVGHISELVSEGIMTVRQVVADLRPNLLSDVGLMAAIKDYVKRFQRDTEIECTVISPNEVIELNKDQSVTVFRIVQESLSNVAKHSLASKVDILFEHHGESLLIKISDDGIGFDSARTEQSFGLLGIKERALMIGASASIESRPGQGAIVSLNIPLALVQSLRE